MSRCALCPGKFTCVQPSGPRIKGGLRFVGEAPGGHENKRGIPFVGPTGQEVDQTHLPAANLRRDDWPFDNAIRCLPDTPQHKLKMTNDKHKALARVCAGHNLIPAIREQQPDLIIAMGTFACYALDPDISLELQHGIPVETKWGTVFPIDHPAGGLHEPKKMTQIMTDFIRLGDYLKGKLLIPEDEYPNPDYRECNGYSDLPEIDPTLPMACDTEWSRSKGVYCLTYSQIPGTGRLIFSEDRDKLYQFQKKIEKWENFIDFHNYLADWPWTEQLGLRFPVKRIRDTMQTAFNLGNFGRIGLKNLCYRELGMDMQDFDDLVIPYSRPHVIDYFRVAAAHEWERPPAQEVRDENGDLKLYKPQSMATKLKRFFTDLEKAPDTKDVFVMWDKNWIDHHDELEEKCGPFPSKDIAHVPYEQLIHYACRDADGTLRLRPILDKMVEASKQGLPQERWREYASR